MPYPPVIRAVAMAIGLSFVPAPVSAQAVYQVTSLFDLFAGLLVAGSLVFFLSGFVLYLARLGRIYRTEGIDLMQWGVSMLFVFIISVGLLRFYTQYPGFFYFCGALILLYGAFKIIAAGQGGGEKKDDAKHAH